MKRARLVYSVMPRMQAASPSFEQRVQAATAHLPMPQPEDMSMNSMEDMTTNAADDVLPPAGEPPPGG